MEKESDFEGETPLINTEKIGQLLSFYKFPLILSFIGILFLFSTLLLLLQGKTDQKVVFETQSSPPAGGSASIKIKVDIEGAVISPGVYELLEGSRIADILTFAGGLSADADRSWVAKNLNRAAKLIDGAKIYIPSESELSSAKSSSSLNISSEEGNLLGTTSKTVNLNTASQAELEALAGVGPVTAAKIISGRPYQTIEELKERKIIGSSLYDKLKESLSLY